jgi:hypothetical protein
MGVTWDVNVDLLSGSVASSRREAAKQAPGLTPTKKLNCSEPEDLTWRRGGGGLSSRHG